MRAAVAACRACGLCETRTQTVFGVGHPRAHWMIVGEAPGENEDRQGEPFVGAAGQLLDAMLAALGLTRHDAPPQRQLHPAGLGVDLDDGDVGAEREGGALGVEAGVDGQLVAVALRNTGELGPRLGHGRRAGDVERARLDVELDVGLGGLERLGGQLLAGLGELDGRLVDGRAALLQRARAHRAVTDGRQVGVAPHERELVDRDAGLGAGDHRPRGVVALAVRRRTRVDGGRAVVVDLDLGVLAVATPPVIST